jgi:hypothetical protein
MNRKIDIEFVEEAVVEIRAVTASTDILWKNVGTREFWLGWQLFGSE